MKLHSAWLAFVTLPFLRVFAVPAPSHHDCAHVVKERVEPPRNWVPLGPAPADHILELRIGLPQPNFHLLEEALYQVSDPYHDRYGVHYSKEAVEEMVAPHPTSVTAVEEWLETYGIGESDLTRSSAGDWVKIRVPIALAEEMLHTTYSIWAHTLDGDLVVRTTSYSLPQYLHPHIELIQPTTMFARLKGMKSTLHWPDHDEEVTYFSQAKAVPTLTQALGSIQVDPSCTQTITLSCLRQLYNATGYNSSATNGNVLGITGYLEQYLNIQDLQQFYALYRPDAVNSTFAYVSINGGQNSQNISEAGPEADLDSQYAWGLTYPTGGIFYSTGGSPPINLSAHTPTNTNEPYAEWIDYVLNQTNPPQTISTSYGDDEQTVPQSYAVRVCNDLAQLGARGVSLLFSSGDFGVGDGNPNPANQTCLTNDGRNLTRFIPDFPASCPFVTTVGGTIGVPETAVFFSGGGFSNYFPRPSYQDSAVTGYLSKLPPGLYEGLYNPNGRAYPDVSALAYNFSIVNQGKLGKIGGTSASGPTFAAIVSLLNDARLSSGLPVLGFLNPLLYTKGIAGLTDITMGHNPGCGTQGFNATTGWDPVTGLGTPNFGMLKDIILSTT
ncbi:hypothetical protein JAAARDRAFT_28073 [Jaapia argillacea MUCL 33604]|uniref:tripeptidyl-peptidase II n=1 Tax=Jaapia argillacea MUCL 33604 TaxID=933084 RepID=A0A067QBY6_9AGAM|nr:hypothetical protein JAAARDRAFT_28073 [Jaapia argillacea MUCL 33604]